MNNPAKSGNLAPKTTPLQQEQDYVANNAIIIDKIKKLEEAVISLINKEENTKGFVYVHNNIIKPTIKKMKAVAEQHKQFINDNKHDQIDSVKSSKGEDIFLLGADMLQNIENMTKYTIQVQLKNKYPIKGITNNNLNVISGGEYRSFTEDRVETKKEDANTNINYKYFYDNITGSSLLNSKQAMLIALYAQLKNIDIVTNYGDVLAKLKEEGIMDYKTDSNLTIKPIKNPKVTSPFMVDGFLVEPTAGYEFGGIRNTKGNNDNKKIYDCSSWIEDLFKTGTLTTGNMVDAISKRTNNDFRNKILTKATRILHYNRDNNKDIMKNLEDGDMFVWAGHVGFVKMIDGKPQMLSYTRDRGEAHTFRSVKERTNDNFQGKRTNIDGFTLEGTKSFENLIKQKDLYIIKFDLNKEGADIPTIEEPEKNNTLCR